MRRQLAIVASVLVWAMQFGAVARAQTEPAELHDRADAALQSFLVKYWNGAYLRGVYPETGSSQAGYWTFAQGFDAVLDGVERTGGRHYKGLIETLYLAQERRGWFNSWFDDMNWMALALIRAFDLTGEPRYLDRAVLLFDRIQGAWDTSCCGAEPGGIWWNQAHSQKATASNAGPVITAVRLADRLEDPSYVDFAIQVYDYWFDQMVDRARWHVWDHIDPNGQKVDWQFSYNEGLMIGAGVELYLATDENRFIADARRIGLFLSREVVRRTSLGDVLSDGSNSSCTGDCHAFKGIAYRYLAQLAEIVPDAVFNDVLEASGESIWKLARAPDEILFSIDWGGPRMSTFSEPQEAAAVMALNIHARLAGAFPAVDSPAGRYEAEDATIDMVRLDNRAGDFSGWAYVTGFTRPGQYVRFQCDAPIDGTYEATFRYSAPGGEAGRQILVNGDTQIDDLRFPETSGADAFSSRTVELDLTAGENWIEVRHDLAKGNSGSLDLDHLQLSPPRPQFLRGDGNADGVLDISDAINTLQVVFLGEGGIPCKDSADADDSGDLDQTDAILTLTYLFLGNGEIPDPGPERCAPDSTDDSLGCESYPPDKCP